jgi:hypothetical protein
LEVIIPNINNYNENKSKKIGIEKLIFGMKQNDVTAIYGKPDRNYKDEDDNVISCVQQTKNAFGCM